MRRPLPRRAAIIGLFLLAVAMVAAGVWRVGYGQALDQLAQRGRADLVLAADRLTGQLQLYQQLAVVLADHPVLSDGDRQARRAMLLEAADKTGARDLLLADAAGRVLVSARGTAPGSIAGSAHFRRAMQGALGQSRGSRGSDGPRAHYYAAPRFDADGRAAGALVVVVDIDAVESQWRGARPAVFLHRPRR